MTVCSPLSRLLSLLYPPRCRFCGALLEKESVVPCRRCRKAAFWLSPSEAVCTPTTGTACLCAAWYEGKLRDAVLRFKFRGRQEYAKAYGHRLAEQLRQGQVTDWDCITWVPVSSARLQSRGYDQAQLLAQETAAALGTTAVPLLEKSRDTPPQSSLRGIAARRDNVRNVYTVPHPESVTDRHILLIDDIVTTGATLSEAAQTLQTAGARQVTMAAFCCARKKPQHS